MSDNSPNTQKQLNEAHTEGYNLAISDAKEVVKENAPYDILLDTILEELDNIKE